MSASPQGPDSGPVRESARITSLDLVRGVAVLGILLMNAVSFRFETAPYLNLSAGGSETWLDWAVGIFGEVFVDQKFMGLFSLLFGAGMVLFIDRASEKGRRAVLLNLWRNALLFLIGILHFALWDGDVLTVYALSALFLIAYCGGCLLDARRGRSRRVRAVHRLHPDLAGHGRRARAIALRSMDSGRGRRGGHHLAALPGGLLPARAGADPRRRRPVPHRVHERRLFGENVPPDRGGRARRRPAARRGRRRHRRGERLLARRRLSPPDSEYARHDSRRAGVHEPHHPVEQPPGRPAQAAPARGREDGADELPHADGAGRARADDAAGRRRLRKPEPVAAVRGRGVGAAAMVVAGVAVALPVRPRGVGVAGRHLPERPAACSPVRTAEARH